MEFANTIPSMAHIPDSLFAERIRASFMRQHAMTLIQATLPVIEHGHTEIHLPVWSGVEQQRGFVHGGVVGMIADSAGGYAAMTLVPAGIPRHTYRHGRRSSTELYGA
ncbi:PaaI family thioesterase [Paraburkholderia sediminicola]|uniref:PaaI family thioesterase n=1 Tax=Paraburkholderia sediminicola TaxID=458836 RepID=UPI0038BC6E6C